jgi:hypothetical protein
VRRQEEAAARRAERLAAQEAQEDGRAMGDE